MHSSRTEIKYQGKDLQLVLCLNAMDARSANASHAFWWMVVFLWQDKVWAPFWTMQHGSQEEIFMTLFIQEKVTWAMFPYDFVTFIYSPKPQLTEEPSSHIQWVCLCLSGGVEAPCWWEDRERYSWKRHSMRWLWMSSARYVFNSSNELGDWNVCIVSNKSGICVPFPTNKVHVY